MSVPSQTSPLRIQIVLHLLSLASCDDFSMNKVVMCAASVDNADMRVRTLRHTFLMIPGKK